MTLRIETCSTGLCSGGGSRFAPDAQSQSKPIGLSVRSEPAAILDV
jgi:hypothetical protein